jgi:hypothetical protein
MQPNLDKQIAQEIERAWRDAAPRIYLAILNSVEQSVRHNPEFAMRRDLDAIVARSLEPLLGRDWQELVAGCKPQFEQEYRALAEEWLTRGRCDRQLNFAPKFKHTRKVDSQPSDWFPAAARFG